MELMEDLAKGINLVKPNSTRKAMTKREIFSGE